MVLCSFHVQCHRLHIAFSRPAAEDRRLADLKSKVYLTATIECDWWSNTVFVTSNGHDLGYCYVWFLRFLPIIKTILVPQKHRDSLTRFIVRAIKKHTTQESQHFLLCFMISTIKQYSGNLCKRYIVYQFEIVCIVIDL